MAGAGGFPRPLRIPKSTTFDPEGAFDPGRNRQGALQQRGRPRARHQPAHRRIPPSQPAEKIRREEHGRAGAQGSQLTRPAYFLATVSLRPRTSTGPRPLPKPPKKTTDASNPGISTISICTSRPSRPFGFPLVSVRFRTGTGEKMRRTICTGLESLRPTEGAFPFRDRRVPTRSKPFALAVAAALGLAVIVSSSEAEAQST